VLVSTRRRRLLGLVLVTVLASCAALLAHAEHGLRWLERPSVDARFSLRGDRHAPKDVTIVGIDNDSLGVLPRYPFSRVLHAHVIERLHTAGARLIVYDISFDRPSAPAPDAALYRAAVRGAPVIFATALISPSGATQVLGGDANLAQAGDRAAAADLLPDGDGVIRHTLGEVSRLPSLAAAVVHSIHPRSASMPASDQGWIDFPGPAGTIPSLSFAQVLRGTFDPAAVKGKVVVVGATAPILQDLHETAAGGPISGPEVQADAIATALGGFPLRSPPPAVTVLLIVGLAALLPLLAARLGALAIMLAGGVGAVCWSIATQLAFNSGVVLDYAEPLAALLLATGGSVLLALRADAVERATLRRQFAEAKAEVVERVLDPVGPHPLEPTAIIAGYRINRIVGRGGMGVVYSATQLTLGRDVALKLVAPERARDDAFRERFQSESRIAAAIEHPNVIPVYEAGEDEGLLFIAMRLVDGLDLAELLNIQGALRPERALRIVNQIAGALVAAHERGLVHRDVKPANVLLALDASEHAYLTDFGLAKRSDDTGGPTQAQQWIGTLDYLSPEQIQGDSISPSVDTYALACVLYQCLTGLVPFPRDNDAAKLWAHVHTAPPLASAVDPSLPPAIDRVIERGMAKQADMRYGSPTELAQACAEALGLEPGNRTENRAGGATSADGGTILRTSISAQGDRPNAQTTRAADSGY
jgi:CHASE2 domain-containing sensor protein/predicted Ser/Thr protein kinase